MTIATVSLLDAFVGLETYATFSFVGKGLERFFFFFCFQFSQQRVTGHPRLLVTADDVPKMPVRSKMNFIFTSKIYHHAR